MNPHVGFQSTNIDAQKSISFADTFNNSFSDILSYIACFDISI